MSVPAFRPTYMMTFPSSRWSRIRWRRQPSTLLALSATSPNEEHRTTHSKATQASPAKNLASSKQAFKSSRRSSEPSMSSALLVCNRWRRWSATSLVLIDRTKTAETSYPIRSIQRVRTLVLIAVMNPSDSRASTSSPWTIAWSPTSNRFHRVERTLFYPKLDFRERCRKCWMRHRSLGIRSLGTCHRW